MNKIEQFILVLGIILIGIPNVLMGYYEKIIINLIFGLLFIFFSLCGILYGLIVSSSELIKKIQE